MRNRSFTYSDIKNNFAFISNSVLFDFNSNDIKRIRSEFNLLFTNIELLNKKKQTEHHVLQQRYQQFHQQQQQHQQQHQHQQQQQQQQQQKLQQHQKLQQKHHYNLRYSSLSNSVSSDQLNDNLSNKEFDLGYDTDKDDKTYDNDMHSDSADSWSSTSDDDIEDQNLLDTTIEFNKKIENTLLENRNIMKALLPTIGTIVPIKSIFQLNDINQELCAISYSKWSKLKLPPKMLNINKSVKKLINYSLITEYMFADEKNRKNIIERIMNTLISFDRINHFLLIKREDLVEVINPSPTINQSIKKCSRYMKKIITNIQIKETMKIFGNSFIASCNLTTRMILIITWKIILNPNKYQ